MRCGEGFVDFAAGDPSAEAGESLREGKGSGRTGIGGSWAFSLSRSFSLLLKSLRSPLLLWRTCDLPGDGAFDVYCSGSPSGVRPESLASILGTVEAPTMV